MALKCIEFTDGTKIPIFARNADIYDDTVIHGPDIVTYSLRNAFVIVSNAAHNGFINAGLSGKTLVDLDGNRWTFVQSGTRAYRLTIRKQNGTIVEKTFSISDYAWYWFIACTEVDEDNNYSLNWFSRRPVNYDNRTTSGSTRYIRTGYINGVNGTRDYSADVSKLNPSDGYVNSFLRNAISGTPFISITGTTLGYQDSTRILTALDYYTNPYGAGSMDSTSFITLSKSVKDLVEDSPDPYGPGGTSGPGGGVGTFDLESDIIGLPPLPTLSFAATGFTRIYNPTLSELNALANYLWTDTTFLDTVINHLKQLLENPMDAVISLSLLPCSIPNGTPEAVKVMYINTGVTMAPATTQFVDVDCGTYSIEEFYGSALDYNPYTKVHCYLPYIGQVTLDTDEVMGRTLNVVYRIDIVTGMCSAMILVDQNVLYQFSGHCAINMPINSADFSGYIGAAMTAGKMVAGVVAGATGNIPLAAELIGAPAPHSSTSETTEKTTERNPKTGRQITAGTSTRTTTRNTPGASFGEMSRKAAANTVGAVMGSKLTVEHAGGFTGNSGYLAVRRPYLIIERPRMCNPGEYGKYNGRPSMIYMNLGECEGYTEVQSIQFENVPATNPELAELSELLKSGVLF